MDRAFDLAFTLLEKPREAGELLLAVFERARAAAFKTGAQPRDRGRRRLACEVACSRTEDERSSTAVGLDMASIPVDQTGSGTWLVLVARSTYYR